MGTAKASVGSSWNEDAYDCRVSAGSGRLRQLAAWDLTVGRDAGADNPDTRRLQLAIRRSLSAMLARGGLPIFMVAAEY
jgi:hypothetical protein